MSGARNLAIKPPVANADRDEGTSSPKFNQYECAIIYAHAERITGTSQRGRYRKDILLNNIERRMHETGISSVTEYLHFAESDPGERQHLVSALTIHTTSWFRELPHYNELERMVRENIEEFLTRPLAIYCAASSTGEEVYSFGLMCELIREDYPKFDYKILGHDIDPISIAKGKKAIYKAEPAIQSIPQKYRKFILMGTGRTEGFFTVDKEIRKRCDFGVANLREKQSVAVLFDIVVCRNALIYFEPGVMNTIVANLLRLLKPGGVFVVGTSDFVEADKHELKDLGKSIYVIEGKVPFEGKSSQPRILVVDDSKTIRNGLTNLLVKEGFRVEAVSSAAEATEFLRREKVSLITLDLHMPGMDGQTWLSQQRGSGLQIPVVIISGADPSETKSVLNALGSGAQDYFEKENLMSNPRRVVEGLKAIIDTYHNKRDKKSKSGAGVFEPKLKIKPKRPSVIMIGSSTGGTEALIRLLEKMSSDCPPIVIVQHINLNYAKPFHERLCRLSGLGLQEAANGTVLKPGTIYMAHADNHIEINEKGHDICIKTTHMAAINGVRPSVDCLFRSGVFLASRACAILLTGMGKDGAQGMLELRKKGAVTLAQDEESCVVFGMPKAAIQLGAVMVVGNLSELRIELKSIIENKPT
ncbi:MAG: hypothetical protein A4S09_01725 [Proteobacteria bacterium SG_bin7]|nr:MAG: hypothetical protein A4S09_01725 [Proteobacteria bacterium SG_bin7]